MTDMTKSDRDNLIRLVKARARQAKSEAETREKVLLAEVQDQITAEYSKRDQLWAEAVVIAEEAARKANELIVARCADLGIPASQAPDVSLGWRSRADKFADPKRRAELRKLAETKLTALTKTAKTLIDRHALDVETALIIGGLESDQARALAAEMPTVDQLMPSLSLRDLGVKGWQPPEGAAAQLLTPSTPADRKRRRILRAIEANPAASDRRIAEIADCDHKTVAAYRRERGELSASAGEIPTASPWDRARSPAEEQVYYEGFAQGWRDRAAFDERAGRIDAVAEAVAYVDGLAEGFRIAQQAAAGGDDRPPPAAKSWVAG